MLITVLLLIVLYLVLQHSLATRCFHCLLAVLFGLSIHTWLTFLLASGLIIFSVADWHERTVPFFSFTGWCLTLLVCFPHDLFGMMLLAVMIGGLAVVSQGLGSADVMLIALLACVLRLEAALIVTLIACGTACLHWIAKDGATLRPALDSCPSAEFANDQSFSGWLCVLCFGQWRTITRSQSQKPTRKGLEAQ